MKKLMSLIMVVGVVFLFSGCAGKIHHLSNYVHDAPYAVSKRVPRIYIKDVIKLEKKDYGIKIKILKRYRVPYVTYDVRHKKGPNYFNIKDTGKYKIIDFWSTTNLEISVKNEKNGKIIKKLIKNASWSVFFNLKNIILGFDTSPEEVTVTVKNSNIEESITFTSDDIKKMNIKNENWEMDDFLLELGQ